MSQRRGCNASGENRSRSPAGHPDTEDPDRSREELLRLGWTKRKALQVLKMYGKWGYDEISKETQRKSKNGFLSLREAKRIGA